MVIRRVLCANSLGSSEIRRKKIWIREQIVVRKSESRGQMGSIQLGDRVSEPNAHGKSRPTLPDG